MKHAEPRFFGLVLLVAILISCATTTDKQIETKAFTTYETPINFSDSGYYSFLRTGPVNSSPVFFAAVQRMSNREEEKTAALLKASEQASKYVALKAVSKFYSEKVNSSMKYLRDLDVLWDRELAAEMIDKLSIQSIAQDSYGTYLVAALSGQKLSLNIPVFEIRNGVPDWTNRVPEIPGYLASVGIALQSGYVPESFEAADNQALEDIARQISVEIVSGKKQIENPVGTASLQTNLEISEVIIPGFYILERWRSPDARYYYSLAVAPESVIENYRNE